MRVGVFYFPTDYGINVAEPARALDDPSRDEILQRLDRCRLLAAA